jgi:hypothetical protein
MEVGRESLRGKLGKVVLAFVYDRIRSEKFVLMGSIDKKGPDGNVRALLSFSASIPGTSGN